MKYYLWVIPFFFMTLFYSCQKMTSDKIDTPEKLESGDELVDYTRYQLDSVQSVATWIISTSDRKYDGTLLLSGRDTLYVGPGGRISGTLHFCMNCVRVSSGIHTDTVLTSTQKLLRSPSLFHTRRYPMAELELLDIQPFDSTQIPPDNQETDGPFRPESLSRFMISHPTHILLARLTVKGHTEEIRLPVALEISPRKLVIESRFNLDRTRWGIDTLAENPSGSFVYHTVNAGLYLQATVAERP